MQINGFIGTGDEPKRDDVLDSKANVGWEITQNSTVRQHVVRLLSKGLEAVSLQSNKDVIFNRLFTSVCLFDSAEEDPGHSESIESRRLLVELIKRKVVRRPSVAEMVERLMQGRKQSILEVEETYDI